MTWVRIDDEAPLHPKLLSIPLQALGLWMAGLCHANRHATDGVILKSAMASLHPSDKTPRWLVTKTAKLLVEAGLWAEANDAYVIVNYERYQSEAMAKRQREKREATAERQRRKRERNKIEELRSMSRNPVPSRPDPDLTTFDQGRDAPPPESGVFTLEPPPAEKPKRKRAAAKPKAPDDAEREAFRVALMAAFAARGLYERPVPKAQLTVGVARVRQHAEKAQLTTEAATAEICRDVAESVARRRPLRFALEEWQPNMAIAAPLRAVKPTRAPTTTHEDFPDDGTFERQLAAMRESPRSALDHG